jgi:tRNA nucleotidyltransferase (CCA-adding enzyme)
MQDLHTRGINLNINYIARRLSPALRNMSSTPCEVVKPLTPMEVKLTPRESQLRGLLLDVARFIDESKEIKERLELRFAGGWVRDKLLGIPSHDIDTAINVMTGSSFTLKMKQFLGDPKNMEKHGLDMKDVGNLHKIAANPEKSKHLETVTTKILGFDVDFVNLRKETYNEHSRNPQMEFGTALEDAERRDATVNALFYNLHTDRVEDYIGGLDDMRSKIMRTPLKPYQTFKDDPLRILRLIRFASRLGFSIHAESEACMGDPSILSALRLKISRERIGTEVEKMLKGMFHYLVPAPFVLTNFKVRVLEVLYNSLIGLDYTLQFSLILQQRLSQNLLLTSGSLRMTA